MEKSIPTTKMSEILWEEFMEPYGISAYRLAQEIHVPTSRIQDILHDRRKITADTSLRLAKFFGVPDSYFLNFNGLEQWKIVEEILTKRSLATKIKLRFRIVGI